MSTAWTLGMMQTATYWAPGESDGTGNVVYTDPPVTVRCRWQNKRVLFRNSSGEEETSSAIVYVDRQLDKKGMLALGDYTGDADSSEFLHPDDAVGAREIRQRDESPSIEAAFTLHKVYL